MKRLPIVLALAAALAPAGGRAQAAFSHKFHIETAGAEECDGCHASSSKGLPTLKKGACGNCHGDEVPPWKFERKALRMPIAFPHAKHEPTGCKSCHAAVLTSENTGGRPMVEQPACAACHLEKAVKVPEARCAACHGTDSKRTAPRDHKAGWMLRHGLESDSRGFDDHGKDCKLCHEADACARCHRERQPQSHTGLWRVRMHGTAASWDPDRCRACHEPGTCASCHRSTRPASHVGSWKSLHMLAAQTTDNESCRACHTPAFCTQCHGREVK